MKPRSLTPQRRRTLSGQLDGRRRTEADIQYAVYVRPAGARGIHVVKLTCNDQEVRVSSSLNRQTFRPGTIVPLGSHTGEQERFIIGAPPPGRIGASGFALDLAVDTFDALGIVSASPATLESGTSNNSVTLTGFGFSQAPLDLFEPVRYNPTTKRDETDPLVTLHSIVWNSASEVEVLVDVNAAAPDLYPISIDPRRA